MVSRLDESTSGSDKISARFDLRFSLTGALKSRPFEARLFELDFEEAWELEDGHRDISGFVEQDESEEELCGLPKIDESQKLFIRIKTYLLFAELLRANAGLGGPETDCLDADLNFKHQI